MSGLLRHNLLLEIEAVEGKTCGIFQVLLHFGGKVSAKDLGPPKHARN